MNIIVCIKEIPDPEIPPAKFKLDKDAMRVIPPEGIPSIINPYDAQALELALQLKEKHSGKITVISIGAPTSTAAVKYALAMGADEGIILADAAFEGSDSFSVAHILSQAIQKIGVYDLVLCGRQAADWDEGLVGSITAEYLGLPLVTLAKEMEVVSQELRVKRVILDGHQIFAVPLPAVVTVSSETGPPRLPSGWGIISASRKQIPLWGAGDIHADASQIGPGAARRRLVQLFIPEHERTCEIIQQETPEEAAMELADRLRSAGILQDAK